MQKLPVVDGDTNADVYGYASSEAEACAVAREYFVDQVDHAYVDGPIALSDGGSLACAWVVIAVTG